MSVLIHAFSQDIDYVPQDVRELSHLISRPLPASLVRVEPSTLSSITQEQLKKVPLEGCDVDGERQDREPLQDVLNLVLITSAAMADCVRIALDGGERRRTTMFITPLLRTLSRVCHDECSVINSVPFIWPKGFNADHGIATMLISLVANESVLHLQEMQPRCLDLSLDATQSEVGDETPCRSQSKDSHAADDKDDDDGGASRDSASVDASEEQSIEHGDLYERTSKNTNTEDNSDDDSSESWYLNAWHQLHDPDCLLEASNDHDGDETQEEPLLDLPLYTQILTGQPIWPSVYFPVICVADSSNIVAHIASVAYQRHVWGIELPVVGLEVSPIGTGVRVHIGWLDPPRDDGSLPIVHTIKPAGNVSGLTAQAAAAQGVFDLAHPHSALLFAQFFLALRPQFSTLWSNISVKSFRRLEWRSDYNNTTWTADIEGWAQDIDKSDDSSTTVSTDEAHPLTPESSFIQDQMVSDKQPSKAKAGISPTGAKKIQSAAAPSLSPAPSKATSLKNKLKALSKASDAESTGTSARTKRKSCSVFAQFKAKKSFKGDSHILTWMTYRGTVLDTKYIPDGPTTPPKTDQQEFARMCGLYDEFTSFRWVEGWTALEKLPAVDPALERLRRELWENYQDISSEPWAKVYLDKEHAKNIGDKLTLLLASADGAFTRTSGPANPLEAEGRHDWDAILSYFYAGEDEATSSNLLLERELRMPRNSLLDTLDNQDTKFRDDLNKQLTTWSDRLFDMVNEVRKKYAPSGPEEAFRQQCLQAALTSEILRSEYTELLKRPDELHARVRKQAEREPRRGKCDALLFTSMPLGDSADVPRQVQEAYKNFRLVIANYAPPPKEQDSTDAGEGSEADLDRFLHPLSTSGVNDDTVDVQRKFKAKLPEPRPRIRKTDIVVPQLLIEYKKPEDPEIKALNQARMYCIAEVAFLAAIGIKNYPAFGLAVHGRIGNVLMGWMGEGGTIHLLERNIRKYDLANPLQAFHFTTFLQRIKTREEELKIRFEQCREQLVADLANGTYKDWAVPDAGSEQANTVLDTALPRVDEEAVEALAGKLGALGLDAAKPSTSPAVEETDKKN